MDEAYGRLDYDRRDGAAIITLRRPEALDALTLDMIDTIRVLESSTGADGKPHPLAAEVFRKLSNAFPDCLFVTEFAADDGSYEKVPAVIPLRQFAAGDAGIPTGRGALAIRPGDEALQGANREKIVAALRGGCVPVLPVDRPLVETWGPKVRDLYREAAVEPAGGK